MFFIQMEDVMKELHKGSRNPKYKKKYKVNNWKEYEQSLCNRGSLTLWISPSVIKSWKPRTTKRRGRQQRFSDGAIETILSLRLIFHLPLRLTESFVTSIIQLMKVKLSVPDHTTLSLRGKTIRPEIYYSLSSKKPLHIIVNSTGLSVHGEGPWASGKKKRRGWRKLHISIENRGRIRSSCVSKRYIIDSNRVSPLLQQIKKTIASFTGDKGYDQSTVYNHVLHHSRNAQIIIHPRSNAVVSDKGKWIHRDKHVQKILDDGVHKWRRESGYYQQSKVENTFYRYKTILGKKLRVRTEESREVETILGCKILNRFLELGHCESKLVA